MAEARPPGALGETLAEISIALVGLHKRFYGKGPVRAKTFLVDNTVLCLLEGGFTIVERTLIDIGRDQVVRDLRHNFQLAMQDQYTEVDREPARSSGHRIPEPGAHRPRRRGRAVHARAERDAERRGGAHAGLPGRRRTDRAVTRAGLGRAGRRQVRASESNSDRLRAPGSAIGSASLACRRVSACRIAPQARVDPDEREQDDDADDGADDPSEIEDVGVADPEAYGENEIAQQRTDQAQHEREQPRGAGVRSTCRARAGAR